MDKAILTAVIFVIMILCYSIRKIPMPLTSMLGITALVLGKCVEPAQVLSTIGSSTVVTMISMFIVSAGLSKTRLIAVLSQKICKVAKGSFTKVLAGYVLVTFILGQFLPTTTATILIVCPLVTAACREMEVNPSKMLYSVALVCCAASWTLTPIGPYAANFVESNGMLAEYGITGVEFTIFDEMIDKIPCTVFVILWAIFAAPKFAPDLPAPQGNSVLSSDRNSTAQKLTPLQEAAGYGIFAAVILCLMFSSFGLPGWLIPMLGACLLVAFGVLSQKEAVGSMGINIIMIYLGAATLGNAFAETGAGELIGNTVGSVLGRSHNSYIIGAVFFIAAYVLTSLIYNRAVSKILIPIILLSSLSMNCDPRGLMRMCYIGSMCSLMTPMATTAVPIIMGAAGYTQRHLFRMSILPALLMCLVSVIFVMTRFPCWS